MKQSTQTVLLSSMKTKNILNHTTLGLLYKLWFHVFSLKWKTQSSNGAITSEDTCVFNSHWVPHTSRFPWSGILQSILTHGIASVGQSVKTYSLALGRHWVPSCGLTKCDGWLGEVARENRNDLCLDWLIDIRN